jgi:hypothetical protein
LKLDALKYSITLTILLGGLLGVNLLALNTFPSILQFSDTVLMEIYLFLFLLNIVHFFILKILLKKWGSYAGVLFMALSLVKMFISLLFILFLIMAQVEHPISPVLNFMFLYFITLILEVLFIAKSNKS